MKKAVCILLSLLMAGSFCGCLRRVEIVETAIIQAIGVDYEDDQYTVTLQEFVSGGSGGQTPVDISKNNRVILQQKGDSISEAVDKIGLQSGKELFFSSNHILIIGLDTAKNGIIPIINFFNSNYQSRPDTHVLISQTSAADIVQANLSQGIIPAESINNLLKRNQYITRIVDATLMDVVDALQNGYIDPYIPLAKIVSDPEGNPQLMLSGTAVFNHDKLVGSLSQEETQGLTFLIGNMDVLPLNIADSLLGVVSVQLHGGKTRYSVRIEDGIPVYTVRVKCTGSINEIVRPQGSGIQVDELPHLEKAVNTQISQLMKSAIEKSVYEYGCDIAYLSKHLKQKQPAFWKAHEKEIEKLLAKSRFEFQVDCNVNRLGLESRHNYVEY